MEHSLRQILADSHIAAVTIAVLLLWSADAAFHAIWAPIFRAIGFLFTAVAIFDIPYFSPALTLGDRFMLFTTAAYFYGSVISFFAAWLLSRWVYGTGPLRSLTRYAKNSIGREDV